MDNDDIIRMAQEAGGFRGELPKGDAWMFFEDVYLERFAALVAAHEREACAKVCEKLHNGSLQEFGALVGDIYNEDCAAAIRARSEK